MPQPTKLLTVILCLASLAGAGCSVHRIEIQQGNIIEPEAREKLATGMTRKQVQFLLGTPMIADPFHRDRWDYLFYLRQGEQVKTHTQLTLLFEGDKLAKIIDVPIVLSTTPTP